MNGMMLQGFSWYLPPDGQHWRRMAERAPELAQLGFTAVWLPPAYKGDGGVTDVGYGVYDLWDLGEFDQKGSVHTKYGTRDDYVEAVRALGLDVPAAAAFAGALRAMGAGLPDGILTADEAVEAVCRLR